ncbi:MAG: ABC transporter ATP-binding protein [Gammaproteobacteria bacterium]|nr:ABC transporter ATP-binding protein [Gammaproteobacteria bacterium]
MSGTATNRENAIAISGLRFGYGSDDDILAIRKLNVGTAQRVFLFGPSGCGKSTLLAMIGGVLVPREGSVAILGENLSRMNSAARDRVRADHVGFIFQQFNLVPYLSVVENVSLPCRYSRRRLKRAIDADGSLENSAARLLSALGIGDELRSRKSTDLSVGQQQRVAAARALIGQPELVLADEPTSSLDADRRREFISLLVSECGRANSTVIFVSHDASLATHFDVAIDLQRTNAAGRRSNAA